MKAPALVAVALLAGCGGRTLRQAAAPAPMPAPALSPASGPRVGPIPPGPQEQRPTLPRSKDRRVVPRAGVWASDTGLRHISTGRDSRPAPETLAGLTPAAWLQCWADVQATLSAEARTATLSDADYECQRWRLLQACGGMYAMRARMGGRAFSKLWGSGFDLQAFLAASGKHLDAECGDTSKSPDSRALYSDLAKAGAPRWRAE